MRGAGFVAITAAIGYMLQGWDNATIAGAILYIKREFKLEKEPTIEGLILALSLIGATIITTFSGAVSDWVGRRPLLIASSVLYFVSGLIMLWSPNVYILLLARLIDGFGIGLAVTLVPVYISETAPPEIRGLLNTLPQLANSGGMFLSYCVAFGMSLMVKPDWRLMLAVLSLPSFLYFVLTVFYLPESPRWLVSKGRMIEAKQVLQMLCGRDDVSGEMSLLVEGLGVGGDTSIKEYIIGLTSELPGDQEPTTEKDKIMLYGPGPEEGVSLVAQPVIRQSAPGSAIGLASLQGSIANRSVPLMDPLVSLFGSVHEKLPEMGSMKSTMFSNFSSTFSVADQQQPRTEEWDEKYGRSDGEDYTSEAGGEFDDHLQAPLLSGQTTTMGEDLNLLHASQGSTLSMRCHSSLMQGNAGEAGSSLDIGGGWQLAWKWSETEDADGKKGEFKRIYLHQEGVPGSHRGSIVSVPGGDIPEYSEYIQASTLVSQPALFSKELMGQHPLGPAMVHPSETAAKGPRCRDLFEGGVRHALFVGIGIQILQQFSGIGGVISYTPQILEQAGVGVLLANMGISSASASILICSLTTLLMLPCIGVAMRLMDSFGRRSLLLATIPVLISSLFVLVVANLVDMGTVVHAVLSTISLVIYLCFFVMGFGPIPNILCSEIFPTRLRGVCIAICSLTYWFGNIIVTYTLPLMLKAIGLAGVFAIYAVLCIIALVFVILKVPETKGMPLEVIIEFFNARANLPSGN